MIPSLEYFSIFRMTCRSGLNVRGGGKSVTKNKKPLMSVRPCDVEEVEGDGGATVSSLLVQSRRMQRGLLQVNRSGHCRV